MEMGISKEMDAEKKIYAISAELAKSLEIDSRDLIMVIVRMELASLVIAFEYIDCKDVQGIPVFAENLVRLMDLKDDFKIGISNEAIYYVQHCKTEENMIDEIMERLRYIILKGRRPVIARSCPAIEYEVKSEDDRESRMILMLANSFTDIIYRICLSDKVTKEPVIENHVHLNYNIEKSKKPEVSVIELEAIKPEGLEPKATESDAKVSVKKADKGNSFFDICFPSNLRKSDPSENVKAESGDKLLNELSMGGTYDPKLDTQLNIKMNVPPDFNSEEPAKSNSKNGGSFKEDDIEITELKMNFHNVLKYCLFPIAAFVQVISLISIFSEISSYGFTVYDFMALSITFAWFVFAGYAYNGILKMDAVGYKWIRRYFIFGAVSNCISIALNMIMFGMYSLGFVFSGIMGLSVALCSLIYYRKREHMFR